MIRFLWFYDLADTAGLVCPLEKWLLFVKLKMTKFQKKRRTVI
jgi:hypothetical protein